VKSRVVGLAFLGLALGSGVALARNFHCAGGIQYVIQGMNEKGKGNLDDAHRIFGKAVGQLSECVKEDPNDNESWSYLGWAYAELDSAPQAGAAFDEGEKRLAAEPKKIETLKNNRKSYWVQYYNQGLGHYKEASAIMKPEDIPNSTDPKAVDARAKLAAAEVSFKNAVAISSQEITAYNNLAIVQALQGKFDDAEATVEAGLKIKPDDQDLKDRKDSMVDNAIKEKIKGGDYTGGLTMLDAMLAKKPNDYPLLVLAAQTAFDQGDKTKDKDPAGGKAAYARAAGYYGHAADNGPAAQDKHDMRFNEAVAFQNAGDDLNEAKVLFALVQDAPKDKSMHAMLRGAYDRLGSKKKADDEVWVILGLNDNAVPVADVPGYVAKVAKVSDAGKTLAANGSPEDVKQFKTEQSTIDIWYYWTKKQAFAFSTGRLVGSANFGEFGPETSGGGGGPAPVGGAGPAKAPTKAPAPKAPVKKG
jgi:tetratricopeptide (TPR) repeat protein